MKVQRRIEFELQSEQESEKGASQMMPFFRNLRDMWFKIILSNFTNIKIKITYTLISMFYEYAQ